MEDETSKDGDEPVVGKGDKHGQEIGGILFLETLSHTSGSA
jgi:hypothetical protein